MKEKDDDYYLLISEIRNGIGYNPISKLTLLMNKLMAEYGLDVEEIEEDIGITEW